MDGSKHYRASNSSRANSKGSTSSRANSSNIWRNTGIEVFSRSSRDEEDEETLKWAALEKLPTFDRLRKGLLLGPKGVNEVEIENLEFEDKRNLVERLVSNVEDYENCLLKLRNRIDRVGIEIPTIEVRYEHLNVDAEAYSASSALPTFVNFHINLVERILNSLHILPSRKKPYTILKDVSGIIKPCRLTLLLGPPSSGKTTLLLALAGRLNPPLKVSGRVTYNGHGMEEFVPQRTAAYVSQHDLLIGEMPVRETLAFSARCQGVGSRYEMLEELTRREKAANIKPDPDIDIFMKAAATEGDEANVVTDYILKVLGLDICADALIGDEMRRGISGGQRKRVTTGEILVGPAKALFMDEIYTGLDGSTSYQIVNMLRQYAHIMRGTAFISLLQPVPETFDLFDDIVLLSEGQIVYQGPRENVLEFFESRGFKCPDRKGVADFLQEVTSKKDQQQYWARKDVPYGFITVSEFAEAFQSHVFGRRVADELAVPYDKSKSHPAALTTRQYGRGKKELLKACADTELLLMKRNSFIHLFRLFQVIFVAIIAIAMFSHTRMHKDDIGDGGVYTGVLFLMVTIVMFNGSNEIALTVQKLPFFYKQRNMFFFPAWAYAIPAWVLSIPITFLESGIMTFLTYYVIGLDHSVGRLTKHYLLLILVHQSALASFRFIGSAARNMIVATMFGLLAMVLQYALGGFVLSRKDVKKWWLWAYWSSPLMYAQNAIILVNGTKLGVLVMESRGFFPQAYWYWIGVGASISFTLLFNILIVVCLTYLNSLGKAQTALLEEAEDDAQKRASDSRVTTQAAAGTTSTEANENRKRGMILPFEPHSITFDDIRYSVDMPPEMKAQRATEDKLEILKGVSGAFRPGFLTALMGVSGSGKTTLMDLLAGRNTGGYIEGNITISGYPKNQETFARISRYCEQNDIHSPNVTVYESLVYSAWLRLPKEVDAQTRKMFIEEIMELVELTPFRGALVGLPGVNGLSTELRKRLTIAVELLANPSIIFMDEPTSGLDARAAAIVMRTVRNTANTGRTVVCTVHQPSIDIFEAFDELFLLEMGGEEIYVGPLGRHSTYLIKYFEAVEGVPKIKDGYNPATWMLEVTTSAQELLLGIDFADHYKKSELYERNKALIKELSVPRPGTRDLHFPTKYSQPFLIQCIACLWKQHWSYWRNTSYTGVRCLVTTLLALIFGTSFWKIGSQQNTRQDLFNAMGVMYSAFTFLGLQYGTTVQPVVAIERTVYYRERAAGMYSALPYAMSHLLIEIPYIFVQSNVYGLIVYSMIGFTWTDKKVFWYIYDMFMTLLCIVFYGMMIVGVTPNQTISNIISVFLFTLWNVFSGFIIPLPRIPGWLRWCYWASPYSYTLYCFIITQYGDVQDRIESGETVEEFVRNYYGFERDMLGFVASMFLVFIVVFTFLFACGIKAINFQRR